MLSLGINDPSTSAITFSVIKHHNKSNVMHLHPRNGNEMSALKCDVYINKHGYIKLSNIFPGHVYALYWRFEVRRRYMWTYYSSHALINFQKQNAMVCIRAWHKMPLTEHRATKHFAKYLWAVGYWLYDSIDNWRYLWHTRNAIIRIVIIKAKNNAIIR